LSDVSELIERLLRWVEPLYQTYGYLVVIAGALLEHTFFLAWAMPGGILVALGGLYAQAGVLALPLVILTGAAGFILGDHLDFVVGRRSTKILERVTKGRTMDPNSFTTLRTLPALALAYTNAVPRAAMFMGGAASGLTYRRFLLLSVSLALFWSATFSILGYWLGSNRQQLTRLLQGVGIGGQILLFGAIGIGVVFYYLRRRRAQRVDD